LIGASFLAVNAWAQAPNSSQVAPPAPAIPMPTEASPLVQPSLAPLRPSSQRVDVTPSGTLVAPASTLVSPAPAGPTMPSAEGTTSTATAPRPSGQVTIDSDLQQADQATGIITATGNVRIIYPDQRVVATARQAQYFTKEDRVVLSGDVDVIQEGGNHLRAERVIYLIKADRVVAEPAPGQQVFSKMVIQQKRALPASAADTTRPGKPGTVTPGSVMTKPATGAMAIEAPAGSNPSTVPRPAAAVTP
jgi:lipopolysaccharide export system protein LptA